MVSVVALDFSDPIFFEGDKDAGFDLSVEDEGAIDGLGVGDTFWV